ncbi:MAG: hypothetical protein FJ004_07590 [Chloroflexi bacterium]|nr:hypothetical protein [Chloroflexota bacterium]
MPKRKILPILAVIFGVSLTGIGTYLIFLAVWDFAKFGFDPERVLAFMFSVFGGLFLIGGVLLLLMAFRGPRKSREDS